MIIEVRVQLIRSGFRYGELVGITDFRGTLNSSVFDMGEFLRHTRMVDSPKWASSVEWKESRQLGSMHSYFNVAQLKCLQLIKFEQKLPGRKFPLISSAKYVAIRRAEGNVKGTTQTTYRAVVSLRPYRLPRYDLLEYYGSDPTRKVVRFPVVPENPADRVVGLCGPHSKELQEGRTSVEKMSTQLQRQLTRS